MSISIVTKKLREQNAALTAERDRYKAALEKIAAHDNENAFLAMKQMEIYARGALKEK